MSKQTHTDEETIMCRASAMAVALALATGNTVVTLEAIAKAIGEDADIVKSLKNKIADFGEYAFGFMGASETGLFCGAEQPDAFDMQICGFYMNFDKMLKQGGEHE